MMLTSDHRTRHPHLRDPQFPFLQLITGPVDRTRVPRDPCARVCQLWNQLDPSLRRPPCSRCPRGTATHVWVLVCRATVSRPLLQVNHPRFQVPVLRFSQLLHQQPKHLANSMSWVILKDGFNMKASGRIMPGGSGYYGGLPSGPSPWATVTLAQLPTCGGLRN